MRKGRFAEEGMAGIPRGADRDPVAQVARKHGVGEQARYTVRQRFSGMPADGVGCGNSNRKTSGSGGCWPLADTRCQWWTPWMPSGTSRY